MGALGGEHVGDALVYDSDEELVAVAAPFLKEGIAAGEAVLLVCAERRNALLVDAVGADPCLSVLPPPQVWRRPTEAMNDYQGLIETQVEAGRRVRIVADSDFGSGPADWSEWARFETASHQATTPYPVWSICLLDSRETPGEVLAATERIHPTLWANGGRARSAAYVGPAENLRRDAYVEADPLEDTPPTLHADGLDGSGDLGRLRHALTVELAGGSLPPWRAYEFVLAVSEIAGNAVRYGRPPVRVRFWSTPERVLCTVTDHGAGFDYPLSSYLPVDPASSGLGLYLARQLCDQMNICWTPDGFTVRLALVTG